jgi:hypothetical protein
MFQLNNFKEKTKFLNNMGMGIVGMIKVTRIVEFEMAGLRLVYVEKDRLNKRPRFVRVDMARFMKVKMVKLIIDRLVELVMVGQMGVFLGMVRLIKVALIVRMAMAGLKVLMVRLMGVTVPRKVKYRRR